MIMNRITDIFFFIGILLTLIIFKTTEFIIIFDLLPFIKNEIFIFVGYAFDLITLISFFFLIGAVGKSAQIGIHT
jgi:NADH:ubiquinone oxidoreductase subunit 5 (subunit L)/multisubunit Na+/H+ antiporter MnhA subunit